MNEKLANILGTKFVGFVLSGFGLMIALMTGKMDGATFGETLTWLFFIFAGGNAVATVGGAVKDAIVAKKAGE